MTTTWNPEEYAAKLPPEQRERWWGLYRSRPEVARKDLTCPDCGAQLVLRLGRYGRFYGCEMYQETGCRGSVTARDNGEPLGKPVPSGSEEKLARRRLMQNRELDAVLFSEASSGTILEDILGSDFGQGDRLKEAIDRVFSADFAFRDVAEPLRFDVLAIAGADTKDDINFESQGVRRRLGEFLQLLQQPPSFARQLQINTLYDHDPDWF